MKSIYIYGGGGFGREVLQIVLDMAAAGMKIKCDGFILDKEYYSEPFIKKIPVYTNFDHFNIESDELILAIGSSHLRKRAAKRLLISYPFIKYATIVHPRAWIGNDVEIGAGSIVCAGCLITTDIFVGKHAHINIGSTVGHDAMLSDFVTLNPSVNISGNVTVMEGCEIGTGSVVIPSSIIGEWSIVGAGSVVTKDIPANVTAVGGPAKVIKERLAGWQN